MREYVLVTGGAGFIGSHLVDRLVKSDYHVRVLDNLSTGNLSNIENHIDSGKIDFIEGDIEDAELVKKCTRDISAVVHLAARTSVPFSVENPDATCATNIMGTLNLLVSSAERKVGKFVFISSCAVYGEPKYLPLDEKHLTEPISPYAESKLIAEQFCLGFHKRQLLTSVVLRLFNVYGPRQSINDYSGVITRFIDRGKQGLPLVIYGDGSQTRDFVNVHDVSEAILSSLETDNAEGEILHIGSGVPTSIRALAEAVLESAGLNVEIIHEKPRLGDIKHSYANVSKAKKLLGYEPKVSLRDGLQDLLAENVLSINEVFTETDKIEI